jgi:hypothetical protein
MAEKINITHHYDEKTDVLYIDFGSAEPCFTEDLDGFLMIDIGWFSKLPRGVRVVSPKSLKVKSIKMFITQAEKECRELMEQRAKQIQTSEPILKNALDSVLNEAFSFVN